MSVRFADTSMTLKSAILITEFRLERLSRVFPTIGHVLSAARLRINSTNNNKDREKEPMNAIEMAIKMETDAIKFYQEASGKTSHPWGKKMFLSIMEDEKRHLQMLESIFKGLDVNIKNVNPMDNIKSIFTTLKDEMQSRIKAETDELSALKVAMQMEKEGVEYYKKAASSAKSPKEKALFERLVVEEQQHYSTFANTLNFLEDTGNWFMWQEKGIVEG